jgi:hypothetical protein
VDGSGIYQKRGSKMAKADKLAGWVYVTENWDEFSPIWKLRILAKYSPDAELRAMISEVFLRAKLQAKISVVAPWYVENDRQSAARLSAMLAHKYGLTWWYEIASKDDAEAMAGAIDYVWHSVAIEPLLDAMKAASEDGPCRNTWRLNGDEIDDAMPPTAAALVRYVWSQHNRTAEVSSLAETVFGDREKIVEMQDVQNHAKYANNFFRKHHIPWKIKSQSAPVGTVSIERKS